MKKIRTGLQSYQLGFSIIVLTMMISCRSTQKVAFIVHHAKIYTTDSTFSTAEAMAIKDGKIVATGTDSAILSRYQSDSTLDAGGKTIYPGFIDAHCHFTGYATDSWKCELTGTGSFKEILDKIVEYAHHAPVSWIYGRGWDQNDWSDKNYPDKTVLDSLFPHRPVFLKRIDGHAAIANQTALDLARVTENTVVEGGAFLKKEGKLTGVLIDNAMSQVEKVIPEISDSLAQRYFDQLQEKCFAQGLTGVHDCGISEHTIDLIDAEQKSGRLKMKIFALLTDSAQYYDRWIKKGPYVTERLHVGGFKLYADGALGSRGACLLHDYSDQPGWKGFLLSEVTHFQTVAEKLSNTTFQMCTHAIGDSGNRTILNIYANKLKEKNDKRWRIEHAQVVNENDFDIFQQYSIIPSVQPTHATSDMYWAESRLGPQRIKSAYAYQLLLKQNGWLALGTDFPVEDISPFRTFLAAVARKDAKMFPAGGFQPANALTREQAIRGMTIWAAKAAFEEKEKGSLEPGKAADFIMLDKDLLHCREEEILQTKVNATYINGESVYRSTENR